MSVCAVTKIISEILNIPTFETEIWRNLNKRCCTRQGQELITKPMKLWQMRDIHKILWQKILYSLFNPFFSCGDRDQFFFFQMPSIFIQSYHSFLWLGVHVLYFSELLISGTWHRRNWVIRLGRVGQNPPCPAKRRFFNFCLYTAQITA